jgi:hypothetical protein
VLSAPWKRVVYVDPTRSFEDIDVRAKTYNDAKDFLSKRWHGKPFRLALTFSDDADYARFFGGLYNVAVATHGTCDNVCLVLDEIDLWSSPRRIEPHVSKLMRYGRHYGICWIAVCRADVETHRDVRMNASEVLVFRQGMLSPEMRRMLESARNVRKEDIAEPAQLERWNTAGPVEESGGRHGKLLPKLMNRVSFGMRPRRGAPRRCGAPLFVPPSGGPTMFDRKTVVSVLVASYALALFVKLVPALSPGAIASYVPSIGGNGKA